MSAVKKMPTAEIVPATPPGEAAAIMSMIERMALNPDIPLERTEQLFALYQRVQADAARKAFDAAFAEMQPKLPIVTRLGQSHNARYARWEDVVEQIAPVIAQHGFSISFRVANPDGKIAVTAILAHREGHREETSYELPSDTSGQKNPIQAIGSTISYGKRYAASALLNIVSRGEDDDARSAGIGDTVSEAQATILRRLIEDAGADQKKLLVVAKAETIEDIRAADFPKLKAILSKKIKGAAS